MSPAATTGPPGATAAGASATIDALAGLGLTDRPLDRLAAMIAAHLDAPRAQVITVHVDTHPYDLPAIITAGRFRVSGTARTGSSDPVRYSFFVKVVQAYARSPLAQQLPAAVRDRVAPLVPWRTEPDLYRADLADRLPDGLTAPRAYGVYDLDEDSAAIWLEMLPARAVTWRLAHHRRAAYLLGRLAANPAMAPLAARVPMVRTARNFTRWWLEHNVIPDLYGDKLWQRKPLAETFDGRLRARMLAAVDALPELLDELESLPTATAHGDACTRNLLIREPDGRLALIDFGFWGTAPIGFDLGQILLGEIQLGQRPAGQLPRLENECLPAYVQGLRDEGSTVSHTQARRAHALLLTIHHAIPAIPIEHRTTEPSPALRRLFENRAHTTRFILDLLDATGPGVGAGEPADGARRHPPGPWWCGALPARSRRHRNAGGRTSPGTQRTAEPGAGPAAPVVDMKTGGASATLERGFCLPWERTKVMNSEWSDHTPDRAGLGLVARSSGDRIDVL